MPTKSTLYDGLQNALPALLDENPKLHVDLQVFVVALIKAASENNREVAWWMINAFLIGQQSHGHPPTPAAANFATELCRLLLPLGKGKT